LLLQGTLPATRWCGHLLLLLLLLLLARVGDASAVSRLATKQGAAYFLCVQE
jgi:hypothetical protein